MNLKDYQKIKLLKIARKSIEKYLMEKIKYEPRVNDKELEKKRGVFVTLKSSGRLRGCLGCIEPENKLAVSVRDMAVSAAVADPRFPPVTPEEIKGLIIEISVLSLPREVSGPGEIKVPGEGVIVEKEGRKGVYLPQVAYETGWDKEKFLSSLCRDKAGLAADAFKDPAARLFSFRAEVFNEKEFNNE